MSIIPPTAKRVQYNTTEKVNRKICRNAMQNIDRYEGANFKTLTGRLKELNKEWDTERFLETNAAALVLISTALGVYKSRKWFLLTGTVGLFLLQHALQGWCPPLPILRKLGVRTEAEINDEKNAIKFFRGDFDIYQK